jgi:hypothetical protein
VAFPVCWVPWQTDFCAMSRLCQAFIYAVMKLNEDLAADMQSGLTALVMFASLSTAALWAGPCLYVLFQGSGSRCPRTSAVRCKIPSLASLGISSLSNFN